MANDAAAAAAIMTIDKYMKGVDDHISDEVVEIYHFMDRKKRFLFNQHGTGIRWNARVTRGTVEGFAREKRLSVVRKNRNVQARLTNRGYGIGELIHQTDLWENGTPEKLADFLDDMLEGMTGDLIDAVGKGFYDDGTDSTYGGLGFEGADAALITTGSYAGINVATSTAFAGNAVTTSVSPYNTFSSDPLPALDAAITACRAGVNGGRSRSAPDVGFMSHDNWNICHQTFLRQMRLPQDVKSLNAGWGDNFTYRGVTFYPSDYIVNAGKTSYLYLFNSRWLDFRFPSPKFINQYRYDEGVPKALYVIMLVYGLIRFKQPRTCGRFLLA